MKAEIAIVKGVPRQKALIGAARPVTIGRSKAADFQITSTVISRVHCQIQHDGKSWVLTDLDSRNGTWVEGDRISTHVLEDGDLFSLGKRVVIRFGVVEQPVVEEAPETEDEPGVCPFCGGELESGAVTADAPDGSTHHKGCLELRKLVATEVGGYRVIERLPGPLHRFRSHQPSLNRHVLLLAFDSDTVDKSGFRERLMEEVKASSKLLHPNIIQIHDFLDHDGACLVAMEFFPSKTLEEVLEKKKFVNVPAALSITNHVAGGLAYAEGEGLVTDRLSPADILVDEENTAKLAYFCSPVAQRVPTPLLPYMAPEVISTRGLRFTGERPAEREPAIRSAVYSLGSILYHMLAGIPPFEGETEEALLPKIVKESPPPLRKVNIK
ncbi:MAG: FHA domain-containing protein, partial [Planctomycetota bacterium]